LTRRSRKSAKFANVLVGTEQAKFTVHEDLLTHHSPFFRKALQGSFKEAEDKTVTLTEECPKIFEFFMHWLYYNRLPADNDTADLLDMWEGEGEGEDDDSEEDTKTKNLIHLYIFCDKYDVRGLRIAAINELCLYMEDRDLWPNLPNHSLITLAFEKLAEDSPLCRYLVDVHCHYAGSDNKIANEPSRYPQPFVTNVLRRYAEYLHGDHMIDDDLDLCNYHEHENPQAHSCCDLNP